MSVRVERKIAIDFQLAGVCRKCDHHKSCRIPCIFVKRYLSENNPMPYEVNSGDFLAVLFPKSRREIYRTDFETFKDGEPKPTQAAFSTETETAFLRDIEPQLKQTMIFTDRFFYRLTFAELSKKYDSSLSDISALYENAKRRLVKTIRAMDRIEFAKENGRPAVKMSKGVRVFLLHILFGLSNHEISGFLEISHSAVSRHISLTKDKILAGQIDVFEYSE